MEVEDYVRTINGIVKIKEIANDVMRDEDDRLHYGDFIKSSPNIIDLIEVGDYVNGYKITTIGNNGIYAEDENSYLINMFTKEDIKSIVTKEQFENCMYKIGE